MSASEGFLRSIPAGGIRSALTGGNTIGGSIREPEPRADGYRHLDTPAMIEKLKELNLNHYFYGVWDSPTDWDDLKSEFLPAAAEAGIQVWPYLVPPSETDLEGRASRPSSWTTSPGRRQLPSCRWSTRTSPRGRSTTSSST